MAAVFKPRANVIAKTVLLGVVFVFAGGLVWWFGYPRSDYARRVGFVIHQPVPFSHEHHVAQLGVGCKTCHSAVEVSAQAGLPPTYTCMTCHSQVWNNADMLAPVRNSLKADQPLVWNRVTNLPDYVYFNHSIHVAKGVGCSNCHGDVAKMQLTYKAASMTMAWCLECHRNPGPQLRPESETYNTSWVRPAGAPTGDAMAAHYKLGTRNLTDCSICHR